MRRFVVTGFVSLVLVGLVAAPSANANQTSATAGAASSRLSLSARITSFRARASGVVASGTLNGTLRSGTSVSHDSAPVNFAVVARRKGRRCNVITLGLAPLDLELLGVQVTTSNINLDVYALRGRVLGDLFCALAHAKVTFPRNARMAHILNSRLHGRPLRVLAASESLPASVAQAQPQTCQVLKLVLGPLNLDLLGLVVDLYGRPTATPWSSRSTRNPAWDCSVSSCAASRVAAGLEHRRSAEPAQQPRPEPDDHPIAKSAEPAWHR